MVMAASDLMLQPNTGPLHVCKAGVVVIAVHNNQIASLQVMSCV